MLGLYIHIPFCVSKCFYCDFASYPGKTALIAPYLKALIKEAGFYKLKTKPGTVYVGGGTPSFLNEEQISKEAFSEMTNYMKNKLKFCLISSTQITAAVLKNLLLNAIPKV